MPRAFVPDVFSVALRTLDRNYLPKMGWGDTGRVQMHHLEAAPRERRNLGASVRPGQASDGVNNDRHDSSGLGSWVLGLGPWALGLTLYALGKLVTCSERVCAAPPPITLDTSRSEDGEFP
jgi:hypothetical protein